MAADDPIDAFMNMLGGGGDKMQLAIMAEKQLDILLKYTQLMYYAHEMEDEELMKQFDRRLKPALELIIDNFDKQVRNYQDKHGEI